MLRSLPPDQLIMQLTSREKTWQDEALVDSEFCESHVRFNVVYSILHLKPQITDHYFREKSKEVD